ncbi:MAG: integration host factor subunit beta [Bacteroidales bacterium]|nr:integration host factor subunit beta [Bacteroidales bacterium]MBS3775553.1 integration host factor subunit beta [Bacteroidales bacterium]
MRKAELIDEMAKKTGIEKKNIEQIMETFMETVKESMIGGEDVYLRGFGSFVVKKRAQKKGRDIGKNKEIVIPEHYIPVFKPSKKFVNRVKQNVTP